MSFLGATLGNLHIPSIGGIKKQISKTDQLMSEKLTGADHTKLDDKFTHMEKVTDVFLEVETEMYEKTRDILYPNPAVRVKQVSDKGIASIGVGIASKTLGGGGNQMLPLPEKALSESMEKGGRKMQELYGQEVSYYGESLILTGESMNQLGDMRTSLEDHVTQNFLCPIDDVRVSGAARRDQIKCDFDLRFLLRIILTTQTNQLAFETEMKTQSFFIKHMRNKI